MARSLTALASAFCLLVVVLAGCGGSDSTSAGSGSGASADATAPSDGTTGANAGSKGSGDGQGGSEGGQEGAGEGSAESGESDITTTPSGESTYKPDRSLQTFGDEVGGRRRAEVTHDALAFLRALAKPDYAEVCARITEKNLATFRQFQEAKGDPPVACPDFAPTILTTGPETRRAAQATITHVRIGGHDSIVFLRPPGGKVGYLPMIREGDRWRSTTLAPGIPLNPQIGGP